MKAIIAYGENGRNLVFEKMQDAMDLFGIKGNNSMARILNKGLPVHNQRTQEKYYLDEIEPEA